MKSPFCRVTHQDGEPEPVQHIQLDKYDRCDFCHSRLIFNHDFNIGTLEVVETSRCPGCGATMNPKKFGIH